MMPIKKYIKIKTIVLYFFIEKNHEINFQNGPEHETTPLINFGFLIKENFIYGFNFRLYKLKRVRNFYSYTKF